MDEETDSVANVQNENAFGDQMPLYPDNYDVKRTVGFLLLFNLLAQLLRKLLVQMLQIDIFVFASVLDLMALLVSLIFQT